MDDHSFEVEASTPLLPGHQQTGDLPYFDLLEGPRSPSRRKRVTHISLVLAALVVVVVLFRSVLSSASPTPQATSPPPTILISSNITFGTVSLNGQRQRGPLPLLYVARTSSTTITVDAPPFHSVTCIMLLTGAGPQGPDSNGQACQMGAGGPATITVNGIPTTPSYWVAIDFTPTDLPPNQQHQIETLLAHAVTTQQTTTVPAGSSIATHFTPDNTISSWRVPTRLQATASLAASTTFGPERGTCIGLLCQLNLDPQESSTLSGLEWLVGVPVALRWRFTTSAGRGVGDAFFPVADVLPTLLAYTPDAGWSLSAHQFSGSFHGPHVLGKLDCETGAQVLQQLQPTNFGYGTSDSQGIEGCQLTSVTTDGAPNGAFLWRFGVLLAANDVAHHVLPTLPIAPPAEISAVQG